MKVMVWPTARGGMRSVVEGYRDDGFLEAQDVHLVASYAEGSFVGRQLLLLKGLARYAWLLATRPVTLVHIHAAMKGSFWRKAIFAGLARRRGVPVILHLHGSEMKSFYERQTPRLKGAIEAQLARASRVVVLSQSWRDFVAGIAPTAKTVVLPNYVTVPARPARGTGEPLTLLFLGLVGVRKGIYDLLEALAMVRAELPPFRLIVGGNGEVEAAAARAQALGLAGLVSFEGWVGPARKAQLLDEADIYVLPSHNEGLPMSVLEAMAYGLPVVTTDVGGLPELVEDGVQGRVVPARDVTALAHALRALAIDGTVRARMGKAGRIRVQASYSQEAVLPALADLYDSVQHDRKPPLPAGDPAMRGKSSAKLV